MLKLKNLIVKLKALAKLMRKSLNQILRRNIVMINMNCIKQRKKLKRKNKLLILRNFKAKLQLILAQLLKKPKIKLNHRDFLKNEKLI